MTGNTSTPLFTVTFWQLALSQVIVGVATAITGPLAGVAAANAVGQHASVPFYSLAISAATGGLLALAHAVGGQQIPGTGPASILPAPKAVRAPAAARKVVKRQTRRPTKPLP